MNAGSCSTCQRDNFIMTVESRMHLPLDPGQPRHSCAVSGEAKTVELQRIASRSAISDKIGNGCPGSRAGCKHEVVVSGTSGQVVVTTSAVDCVVATSAVEE